MEFKRYPVHCRQKPVNNAGGISLQMLKEYSERLHRDVIYAMSAMIHPGETNYRNRPTIYSQDEHQIPDLVA